MGARGGFIAPDEVTFEYVKGREYAPKGDEWERAVAYWKTLKSDDDAVFDKELVFDAKDIEPRITYGTNPGMGWSTICLPNNAKVPSGEIWVYAAVSINDNVITLKKVDYVNANVGYVVYGKAGTYTFRGSSNKTKYKSYLSGNPSDAKVSASTTNCYTLAYKANVSGIGFYKYTGTWLNPYKAYLDVEVFKQLNNSSEDESALLSKASAKGIRFVFAPDDDVTNLPLRDLKATITYDTDAIYDLSGRRILNPLPGHIYIINGTSTLWQ